MQSFFATEAVIPLRKEPSEAAEMISQLLFGETGEILESRGPWCRVRHQVDGYEGWLDQKMITPVTEDDLQGVSTWMRVWNGALKMPGESWMALPRGARIPLGADNGRINMGGFSAGITSRLEIRGEQAPAQLTGIAMSYLHVPYLWGGRSTWGIDCSGLVQQVFAWCGIPLPRDSRPQGAQGAPVAWGSQQAGDVAFFKKANQNAISHVGILCDEHRIIHASGKVRLDFLTENGIIHNNTDALTHELVSIKRFLKQ